MERKPASEERRWIAILWRDWNNWWMELVSQYIQLIAGGVVSMLGFFGQRWSVGTWNVTWWRIAAFGALCASFGGWRAGERRGERLEEIINSLNREIANLKSARPEIRIGGTPTMIQKDDLPLMMASLENIGSDTASNVSIHCELYATNGDSLGYGHKQIPHDLSPSKAIQFGLALPKVPPLPCLIAIRLSPTGRISELTFNQRPAVFKWTATENGVLLLADSEEFALVSEQFTPPLV